jgi:multisubunit Na+/H+ antiporter MnhG subunit
VSAILVDIVISVLLVVGAGFAAIGVIGLLLFPDIRSRMFTGMRATLISCGAIFLAGVIYSLFNLFAIGGTQYASFTVYAVIFFLLIMILNQFAAREILRQTKDLNRIISSGTIESIEKIDPDEQQ